MLSGCLYSSIDGLFFDLFFECPIDVNYSYVPEAPCTRMLLSASGGTQKSKRRRRRPTSKFLLPSRPNSECHVSRPPRLSESDTLALCRSVGRQMPRTRTSLPRPIRSKIPLLLRRIHRAGDPRTPGRRRRSFREFNEFRPANFFSSPWTFSPPLHAVAAGCPNFIPRLKSPRLTS